MEMKPHVIVKMTCYHVEDSPVTGKTVWLRPVHTVDPADPDFAATQAVPDGQFQVTLTEPEASAKFEVGKQYKLGLWPVA